MNNKRKIEHNFEIVFRIPELGIEHCENIHIKGLQNIIDQLNKKFERSIIKCCQSEFLNNIVSMKEKGELIAPGNNEMSDVAKFLNSAFDIRQDRFPDREYDVKSLRSMLYNHTGINDLE